MQIRKDFLDDTGILRWSKTTAKSRAAEILEEFYPDGAAPDIICTCLLYTSIDVNQETLSGTVKELPSREAIDVPVNEMIIVELYSK